MVLKMDTLVDDTNTRLAQRIRLEREARGWALAALADRSGVSKAAISKIERGDSSPTAAVLVRLASAFELTLAGLLTLAESQGGRLVRAGEQPQWADPATGYVRRQVFGRPDHPVEIVEVTMPPGKSVTLPASSYARIRQVVQAIEGRLTLTEGGERHVLEEGDALGFGPPGQVVFANETATPVRYRVVLSRS